MVGTKLEPEPFGEQREWVMAILKNLSLQWLILLLSLYQVMYI
jgi:hypothetical protein